MPVVRMRYKVYKGQLVPMVTLGVRYKELWYPVEAYVDSGATYSIFTHKLADRIGLDFKKGRLFYARIGDGRSIPAYLHDLEVQLGKERFVGAFGFSEKLGIGFNLLGRASFFSRFKVCFDERGHWVTFDKYPEPESG